MFCLVGSGDFTSGQRCKRETAYQNRQTGFGVYPYRNARAVLRDLFTEFSLSPACATFALKEMRDILVDGEGAFLLQGVTGDRLPAKGAEEFDFQVGESATQHQRHLLIAHKGAYKAAPEIGVGIADELNGENPQALLIKAERNFEYDGMRVVTLAYGADGKIYVDATYE